MPPTANQTSGLFGIAFLQAVRRLLPQLLLAMIAAGLATFLAQSWITPRYVAEARLLPDENSAAHSDLEAHLKALKDPIRLFEVATELGLKRVPEFSGKKRGSIPILSQFWSDRSGPLQRLQDQDERVLAAVYEKYSVSMAGDGTIRVSFTASDPQLAARFVNRLVEVYLAGLWSPQPSASESKPTSIHDVLWAEAPEKPVFPRKGPMAILAMVLMLLLGLGGIALREAIHTTPRRGRQPVEDLTAAEENNAAALGFRKLRSPIAVADHLLALPAADRGCRTMVAGEEPDIDATAEALALADALTAGGRRVVLVRWSRTGGEVSGAPAMQGTLGFNDLLEGRASFEEIISRLPGSPAHAIAAGSALRDEKAALDPNLLSLVLDTLDEVYDHIVVLAEHGEARVLFEVLEGRFDACISVGEAGRPAGILTASFDRFLGFEVSDIHVLRMERPRQKAQPITPSPALQTRLA